MKKYKINLFKFFPIIILLSLFSCDDYLDLRPEDALVQQDFWKTEDQVYSAVIGCYASMTRPDLSERVLKWGELRAEMLISTSASANDRNMINNFVLSSNKLTDWSSFYNTINKCNLVLEFADDAKANDLSFSEESLKAFKAEVTTIRSLMYFILVKNFREVPLVLEATATSGAEFYPKKNTEEKIMKQIIDDLTSDLVTENLPKGYAESVAHDKGRITQGAALAILADVYLWNSQYDECITACEKIDDLKKYSLVDGSTWFFSNFSRGNSTESIFELQYDDNNLNSTLRNSFDDEEGSFAAYSDLFELYHDDGTVNDQRGLLGTFDVSTNDRRASIFKYSALTKIGSYREETEFFNNFIYYRYADVLLMKAEAYTLSSTKQDLDLAYDLINEVHKRSTGVDLFKDIEQGTILDNILLERQKEFAYEGKRWYDLLRFAKRNNFERQDIILDLVEIKAGVDNFEQILSFFSEEESYYLPIYSNELNLNFNLEQNPFYIN